FDGLAFSRGSSEPRQAGKMRKTQNPIRISKSEASPKSEVQIVHANALATESIGISDSPFEFPSDFEFRLSNLCSDRVSRIAETHTLAFLDTATLATRMHDHSRSTNLPLSEHFSEQDL